MTTRKNRRFVLATKAIVRRESFGGIVYFRGAIYRVPETGWSILEQLATPRSLREITDMAQQSFSASTPEVRRDVHSFVSVLRDKGIIVPEKQTRKRRAKLDQTVGVGEAVHSAEELLADRCEEGVLGEEHSHLSSPLQLYWEITGRCNLRCAHCFSAPQVRADMTEDEVRCAIEIFARARVLGISIGGGEPLLRPDVLDIAERLRRHRITLTLSTNGTLIDKALAAELHRLWVPAQITIHSSVPDEHDRFTGVAGSFEKAIGAIQILGRERVPVTMNTVMMRWNLGRIPSIVRLALKLGVPMFRVMELMPVGRATGSWDQLAIPRLERKMFMRRMLKKQAKIKGKLDFYVEDHFSFLDDDHVQSAEGDPTAIGCVAARTSAAVLPDGGLTPCSFLRTDDFVGGNVIRDSFNDIWQKSPPFANLRNLYRLGGRCCHCRHLGVCKGGCRALSYLLSGDMLAPDPRCTYGRRECGVDES